MQWRNKVCKKLSAETKFRTLQCILAQLYFPLLSILLPVCVFCIAPTSYMEFQVFKLKLGSTMGKTSA